MYAKHYKNIFIGLIKITLIFHCNFITNFNSKVWTMGFICTAFLIEKVENQPAYTLLLIFRAINILLVILTNVVAFIINLKKVVQ
jgi:hypothetical protein